MVKRLIPKEHCPTWCCGKAVDVSRRIDRKRGNAAWKNYEKEAEK